MFILIIKYKISILAEGVFSMLLIILINILINIIYINIISTCTGLLVIISNIFIFLAAELLLYLLPIVILRDLIIFIT